MSMFNLERKYAGVFLDMSGSRVEVRLEMPDAAKTPTILDWRIALSRTNRHRAASYRWLFVADPVTAKVLPNDQELVWFSKKADERGRPQAEASTSTGDEGTSEGDAAVEERTKASRIPQRRVVRSCVDIPDADALTLGFYTVPNLVDDLCDAEPWQRADRNIVLRTVEEVDGTQLLKYASWDLQTNYELLEAACEQTGGRVFLYLFLDTALMQAFGGEEIRALVLYTVRANRDALAFVGDIFRDDAEVVRTALRGKAVGVQKNAVNVAGSAGGAPAPGGEENPLRRLHIPLLWHASGRLRDDRDFMLEALALDGDHFVGCSEALQNDRDFILQALEENKLSMKKFSFFRAAGADVKKDREVVAAYLKIHGEHILDAPAKWQRDGEMLLLALVTAPHLLPYCSEEVRADRRFVGAALSVGAVM